MKCPNCGVENPSSATVCQCGYDLATGQAGLQKSLKKQAQLIQEKAKQIRVDSDALREEAKNTTIAPSTRVGTSPVPQHKGVFLFLGLALMAFGGFMILVVIIGPPEEEVVLLMRLFVFLSLGMVPISGGVLLFRLRKIHFSETKVKRVAFVALGMLSLMVGTWVSFFTIQDLVEGGLEGWSEVGLELFFSLQMILIIGGILLFKRAWSGPRQEDVGIRLYTRGSIFGGTFLGGSLAATYLLSKNFRSLERDNAARKTLLLGTAYTIIVFGFLALGSTTSVPFWGMQCLIAGYVVQTYQEGQIEEHLNTAGKKFAILNTVLVVVLALTLTYLYELTVIILADSMGLISVIEP